MLVIHHINSKNTVILIGAEKAFDIIQYLFLIKKKVLEN